MKVSALAMARPRQSTDYPDRYCKNRAVLNEGQGEALHRYSALTLRPIW